MSSPKSPGKTLEIEGLSTYYQVYGEGDVAIVVLSGLGTSILEYSKLGQALQNQAQVLLLERPGYSWSQPLKEKSAKGFIGQLSAEIQTLLPKQRLIFVGFNIGADIATQVAKNFEERTIGIIAVSPLPDLNLDIAKALSDELKPIFTDQTDLLRRSAIATRLGFLRFVNMTPYEVPKEIYDDVINNLSSTRTAESASFEYELFKNQDLPRSFKNMTVIRHNSAEHMAFLKQYELSEDKVKAIEDVWKVSAEHLASKSTHGKTIEVSKGVFALHLEPAKEILDTIRAYLPGQM